MTFSRHHRSRTNKQITSAFDLTEGNEPESKELKRIVRKTDLCRQFADNALDRIRSEFTWEKKAEKIASIYHEVLENASAQ